MSVICIYWKTCHVKRCHHAQLHEYVVDDCGCGCKGPLGKHHYVCFPVDLITVKEEVSG